MTDTKEIVRALPKNRKPPRGGEAVLNSMIGATIREIGSFASYQEIEGGGLVIEYETANGARHRAVFGFTELGMWVEEAHSSMV
jgi:hypothetical protein